MTSQVLLLGNAGAGKSFLLNSLGGAFKTGFSVVNGLTMDCSHCDVQIGSSVVRLIDAPGLLEAVDEKVERNARAITSALRSKGTFKLIFVLTECAGRVNPSDLFTIGKVLSAIDFSIDVGVIINKVPEEDMGFYREGAARNQIIEQLNALANGKIRSSWFVVIPRFPHGNPTGPRPYMTRLLSDMTSQSIRRVEPIKANTKEYNHFIQFVLSITQWVLGLWLMFEQYLLPFLQM